MISPYITKLSESPMFRKLTKNCHQSRIIFDMFNSLPEQSEPLEALILGSDVIPIWRVIVCTFGTPAAGTASRNTLALGLMTSLWFGYRQFDHLLLDFSLSL